jgi:hypothetical protein
LFFNARSTLEGEFPGIRVYNVKGADSLSDNGLIVLRAETWDCIAFSLKTSEDLKLLQLHKSESDPYNISVGVGDLNEWKQRLVKAFPDEKETIDSIDLSLPQSHQSMGLTNNEGTGHTKVLLSNNKNNRYYFIDSYWSQASP